MSKRAKLCLFAGLGSAVVALAAMAAVSFLPARTSRDAFDEIREGMSMQEVERILGGPPGDYATEPVSICGVDLGGPPRRASTWTFNDGMIEITQDDHGRVASKVWRGTFRLGLIERTRAWLGQ
jgi:hypothetical protein